MNPDGPNLDLDNLRVGDDAREVLVAGGALERVADAPRRPAVDFLELFAESLHESSEKQNTMKTCIV